jgi:SAM-dependent methyltransferase
LPRLPQRFCGCDIDADNVAWCTEHLPGRYSTSSLRPPLPYQQGAFDLIYGVSVFTHFRPELETLWLAELKRVSTPGALLMMTVHGRTTVDYARHGVAARYKLLKRIEHKGILCSGRNAQLNGHAIHEDEYVNVYHSRRYIDRTWGGHFEIVEVLPGYLFRHDLVIMRRH